LLTREERRAYLDPVANQSIAPDHVKRLRQCNGLVFVFPTWWYGVPAILKGYFDRVWLPGVTFEVKGPRTIPLLTHIERLGIVTTFGSPWWLNNLYVGSPNRKFFLRGIRRLLSPHVRNAWLPLYGLDYVSQARREQFLKKVEDRMRSF